MSGRARRGATCATLPSNTAQKYHEQQVEEHLELAARGRLRCFACGKSQFHNQVRCHPKLFVHVCSRCHDVYHQGEFEVAYDGREMYCRMCGDGGELTSCDERQAHTRRPCPFSFCLACIERNFGYEHRVHSSHKFKCWICDDGPMEQLRRRIPGYEHNSKSILTSLIMQGPSCRGAGSGSAGKDSKPESRVGKGGVADGTGAKPRPKKAASSSSASTLSLSETESDRPLPPPCGRRQQQRRRQQPRPTGLCGGGAQQPAASRRRCPVSESGDESCPSEGFPDYDGGEDGTGGGGGGGSGSSGSDKGRNGHRGGSGVAPAVGRAPLAAAPPPGGPGKGATLLDVPYSPPRGRGTGWAGLEGTGGGGGGGGYDHSWKSNTPGGGGDGEGSAAGGGMSTDSSDSDNDSTGGDGGSRGRRRGREGKRNTAGTEDGVFDWDRRHLINDLSRGLENVKIQVCNNEDEEKLPFFRYVTGYVMGGDVHQKKDPDDMVCCDCTEGCRDPNLCACLRLRAGKAGSAYSANIAGSGGGGGGGAAAEATVEEEGPGRRRFYNDDGLLLHLPDAIFECHSGCACNPRRCKNRVVSRGVHLPLQVFRCAEPGKGWGLRCVEPIPAGSFVACYLGEVLTDRSVDDRGRQTHDDYVFGLDFATCAARQGQSGGGSGSKSSRRRSVAIASSSNADPSNWGLRLPLTAPAAASASSPWRSGNITAASTAAVGGAPGGGGGGASSSPSVSQKSPPARKKPRTSPSSPLAAAAGAGAGGGLSKEEEEAFGDFGVSPNREALLEGFVGTTGCTSRERAAYFLRGAGGNLEVAVNHFFDAPDGAGDADDADAGGGAAAGAGADGGSEGVGGDKGACAGDDADDEMGESEDNGSGSGSGNHAPGDSGDDGIAEGIPPAHLSDTERRQWVRRHNQRERMMYLRQQQEVDAEQHVPRNGSGYDVAALSPAPPLPCAEAKQAGGGGGATAGGGGASARKTTVSPPSSPAEVLWQEVGDDFGGGGGAAAAAAAGTGTGMIVAPWRCGRVAIVAEPVTKNVVPSGLTSPPSSSATPPPLDELPDPKRTRRGDDLHESLCEIVDRPGHPPAAVSSPGPPQGPRESDGQWLSRRSDKTPRKTSTSSIATAAGSAVGTATAAVSTATAAAAAAAQQEAKDGEGLFAEMDLSLEDDPTTAVSPTRPPRPAATAEDAAPSTAEDSHRTPLPRRKVAARTTGGEDPAIDIDIAAAAGAGAGGSAGGGGNGVDFEGEAWTPYSPRSDVSAEMAVDAKDFGNVARFMNHSCDGNLVKKMVFVEGHDFRIPRVAFFSLEKIKAYEELTYDYNYKVGSVEGRSLACRCGAPSCRGMLL